MGSISALQPITVGLYEKAVGVGRGRTGTHTHTQMQKTTAYIEKIHMHPHR